MAKNTFSASGPSQRQLRVGELIRRSLADVLMRGDIMAIVHVTPLGGGNADVVIAALNRNKHELRRAVNKSMTLKYSPDLKFVYDQTFDQMDETRRLLNQDTVKQDLTDDEG